MSQLTAERVEEIFAKCLVEPSEALADLDVVSTEGIMTKATFNHGRIAHYQPEIEQMLDELPSEFQRSGGGGWSFVNACKDKHGNQWTDLHATMEKLFHLGIAIQKVRLLLPREMWILLPGGMPYYVID